MAKQNIASTPDRDPTKTAGCSPVAAADSTSTPDWPAGLADLFNEPEFDDARIKLGSVLLSSGAYRPEIVMDMIDGLHRHARGDWGEVGQAVRRANERAMAERHQVVSIHGSASGKKLRFITDLDRQETTVMVFDDC